MPYSVTIADQSGIYNNSQPQCYNIPPQQLVEAVFFISHFDLKVLDQIQTNDSQVITINQLLHCGDRVW